MRKDFNLPESDETYLNNAGLPWETIIENLTRWLIIHEWKIPAGYNFDKSSLALMIPGNYSDSEIDMVYFQQHIARKDSKPIGALLPVNVLGAPWQRWSRHRTAKNPWRPGVDDLESHLILVDEWLQREFERHP